MLIQHFITSEETGWGGVAQLVKTWDRGLGNLKIRGSKTRDGQPIRGANG